MDHIHATQPISEVIADGAAAADTRVRVLGD
jgi:hypothetical protein